MTWPDISLWVSPLCQTDPTSCCGTWPWLPSVLQVLSLQSYDLSLFLCCVFEYKGSGKNLRVVLQPTRVMFLWPEAEGVCCIPQGMHGAVQEDGTALGEGGHPHIAWWQLLGGSQARAREQNRNSVCGQARVCVWSSQPVPFSLHTCQGTEQPPLWVLLSHASIWS